MDPRRAEHLRSLIEEAIQADAAAVASQAAEDAARKNRERADDRRRTSVHALAGELNGAVIRYGESLVRIDGTGGYTKLVLAPIESVPLVAPTTPVPPPAPSVVLKAPPQPPAANKPLVTPPAPNVIPPAAPTMAKVPDAAKKAASGK
jgi:hypothetical protein